MKKISLMIAPAILPILVGCLASPYRAPPPEERAHLRVVADQAAALSSVKVVIYPSGSCDAPMKFGMVGGFARLTSPKVLGMPGGETLDPKSVLERSIPADKPFLLSFSMKSMDGNCEGTARITAQRGRNYQADLKWDAVSCKIRFTKIGQPGSAALATPDEGLLDAPICLKGFD